MRGSGSIPFYFDSNPYFVNENTNKVRKGPARHCVNSRGNVKVFFKRRQRSNAKIYGTVGNAMSKGSRMPNMNVTFLE